MPSDKPCTCKPCQRFRREQDQRDTDRFLRWRLAGLGREIEERDMHNPMRKVTA